MYDVAVVGGGFYGAVIAAAMVKEHGFANVILLEREDRLLGRASYANQARIHNGYHYPRSFTTAFRSRVNLPRFMRDYPSVVRRDFTKLYAIARRNSKVTARQFRGFCNEIGVRLEPAPTDLTTLFEPRLIEQVFLTEEYAFDADELRKCAIAGLDDAGVEVATGTHVASISKADFGFELECVGGHGLERVVRTRYVFNCTYSGLNQLTAGLSGTRSALKHEISEMALLDVPPALKGLGVTVMDGPFFSLMPFPPLALHTLSHVRYTPHRHWKDASGRSPYEELEDYDRRTRVDRMVRDVARYMPHIVNARYVRSLFEVKTVLEKSEIDDGRPILFERYVDMPGLYSILGGKIDNIYDCLEAIDIEFAALGHSRQGVARS